MRKIVMLAAAFAVMTVGAQDVAPPPKSVEIELRCNGLVCLVPQPIIEQIMRANAEIAAENATLRFQLEEAKKKQVVEKKCGTVTVVPVPTEGGRS